MPQTGHDGHGSGGGEPTLLVVLAAIVVLAASLLLPASSDDDPGTEEAAAPVEWDERLAPYVDFVAEQRELEWRHAVPAEFLSEAEFRERVTASEEPTEDEAREIEQFEGVLRALGLIEGDIDLLAAEEQAVAEGILGYYSPEEDVMVIRGDEVTPELAPVIVHELTHALQAQHFDLAPELELSGEQLAFRTLVEADATRIEQAYLASRPPAEQDAYYDAQVEHSEGQDLEDVPPFITELLAFPYALGPAWLTTVIDERSDNVVDELFREPPSTEEHIVLPGTYLDDEEVSEVESPPLREGEEAFGEPNDFGMASMLLVLGERLPWADAWAATQGWDGDAAVMFRRDDRDCIRVRFQMDDDRTARALGGTLERWIGARDDAEVDVVDDLVTFESCDPGTDVASAPRDGPRVFDVLALRANLVPALANGVSTTVAACVVDHLLLVAPGPARTLELASATDPNGPEAAEIQAHVADGFEGCGP
ncbi:MAG TPA: DUF6782 family putative metallopeptidase [Acidimicrobiales bacterium]|nr:DUF6782 family putative metallopeptidase [Acidimicrobiales bacterium]